VVFESRVDQSSWQVSTNADTRFWFRLEREADRDVVTDYFLGSFPKERGGALLVECYRTLGLTPKMTLEFRDILSGKNPADIEVRDEAQEFYADAGKFLLAEFGASGVQQRFDNYRGKLNLVLSAVMS